MNPIINLNRDKIAQICQKHYIKKLYVFGSAATKDFTENSDVDFLYEIDIENFKDWDKGEYDYTTNLLSFEASLEDLLKRKIDLVPGIAIQNKYFKASVDASKELIYAA